MILRPSATRRWRISPQCALPVFLFLAIFILLHSAPAINLVAYPTPRSYPEVLKAPWPGSWDVPSKADTTPGGSENDVMLMLHIFSTSSSKSRARRQLIRQYSPLSTTMKDHQVEIKFILGYPSVDTNEREEEEIKRETAEHGDVIRLEGLVRGDNINEGKTWEWLRWVGRRTDGQARWVFKCDDDALAVLSNLMPILKKLDAQTPTYIGSSYMTENALGHYYQGGFYGLSWGVVKTLAVAKVSEGVRTEFAHEDARTGELMHSLPSKPSCISATSYSCRPDKHNLGFWPMYGPRSPDPRTGLVRMDLWKRIKHYRSSSATGSIVAWHGLKADADYIEAWTALQR